MCNCQVCAHRWKNSRFVASNQLLYMQGLCYELDAGFQFAARMLPVLVDYDSLVHRQERYPIWAYGVLGQSVQYTKVLLVLLMLLLLLLLLWILSLLLRLTLFQQHFSCSATTSYQDDVPRRQNKCQPVVCKKPMTSLLYTKVKIFCQKKTTKLEPLGNRTHDVCEEVWLIYPIDGTISHCFCNNHWSA